MIYVCLGNVCVYIYKCAGFHVAYTMAGPHIMCILLTHSSHSIFEMLQHPRLNRRLVHVMLEAFLTQVRLLFQPLIFFLICSLPPCNAAFIYIIPIHTYYMHVYKHTHTLSLSLICLSHTHILSYPCPLFIAQLFEKNKFNVVFRLLHAHHRNIDGQAGKKA